MTLLYLIVYGYNIMTLYNISNMLFKHTHTHTQVPKLPASMQYLRYYISYQSQSMTSPSYVNFNPSSGINSNLEGSKTNYTLTSLTRDTEYDIQIRAEVRYSACTTYVAGNYSNVVTLRSNNTCTCIANHSISTVENIIAIYNSSTTF